MHTCKFIILEDKCLSVPCDHGICKYFNNTNGYICSCDQGWVGVHCDKSMYKEHKLKTFYLIYLYTYIHTHIYIHTLCLTAYIYGLHRFVNILHYFR